MSSLRPGKHITYPGKIMNCKFEGAQSSYNYFSKESPIIKLDHSMVQVLIAHKTLNRLEIYPDWLGYLYMYRYDVFYSSVKGKEEVVDAQIRVMDDHSYIFSSVRYLPGTK